MLQKLHDNIKGWVAGLVIAVVCLAFVFWGVQSYVGGPGSKGKTVAVVDGKKITESDVNQLYAQIQRQVSSKGTTLTTQVNKQIKAIALQRLIAQAALTQEAIKNGFHVDKAQVQQVIMTIPQFQDNGHFSEQRFNQFVYGSGMSQKQFIKQLETEILISQVATGIQYSGFTLPSEFKADYNLIYQQRSFSYLIIPAKKFASEVRVNQQQEKDYYKNNLDQFRVPEKVSLSYIELSPKTISKNITYTDKQLLQYYQSNIGNYRQPATWKIEKITIALPRGASQVETDAARKKMQKILLKLKKGTKFATLVQQEKGTTETIGEGKTSAQVLAVVKRLKPLAVSAPFNSEKGYTLIRLDSMTAAKTQLFAAVKDNIKAMLVKQKAQQIISNMTDQLANLTYTNPDSLQPAASALKVKIQETPLFSKRGTKMGLTSSPNVVEAAFSKDVMGGGNNSNPITLKDGAVVVLRVKQHVKSTVIPLKTVKRKIHETLLTKMAQAKAALLANEIQTELAKGVTANTVASKNQLAWVDLDNVGRTDKNIPPAILKAAFTLAPQKNNNLTIVAMANADTAVLQLHAIAKPAADKLSAIQKKQLLDKIQKFKSTLIYQLYLTSVKQKVSIKYPNK